MPPALSMPHDKHSAKELMKKFSDMAYASSHQKYFEKAVHILYGKDFSIKLDLSKRMSFFCKLCTKDMNSEVAIAQHSQSGSHQKNLDRRYREEGDESSNEYVKYPRDESSNDYVKHPHRETLHGGNDNLRSKLSSSKIKPVGLQMIEEFKNGFKRYYKCTLCGAHGKLDSMYRHVIGTKHTEKYIKVRVFLGNSILTTNEREFIHNFLVMKEGIPMSSIKTYRDKRLYPIKWEKCISQDFSKNRLDSARMIPSPSMSSKSSRSSTPERSPESPLSMFRNPSPSRDDKMKSECDEPAWNQPQSTNSVIKQDQSTQNYDLEELMAQLNFLVKTSHLPGFEIRNNEDAEAALDMMFKISSALHFITKSAIENSAKDSSEKQDHLNHKKELLSKIMGGIKLKMEKALKEIKRRELSGVSDVTTH